MGRVACLFLVFLAVICSRPLHAQEAAGPERWGWETAIAAFEEADRADPPPKNAVLFVGSSSIRLWDLKESFPDLEAINRGFGGSEIADAVHYADRIILKHAPRTVVLYAGDNDLARGKSPAEVAEDFKTFAKTIHAALPETEIVFIAIKPSIARRKLVDQIKEANALIATHCREHEPLQYVDVVTPMLGEDGLPRRELFVEDGLHLNEAGYTLWTSLIRPHVIDDN